MSARSRLAKALGRRKGPALFEADLDPTFSGDVIAEVEGGERLLACIQCGTCAGACPLSMFMDRTPRRLIEMIRAGDRDEVLGSSAIWVCASCYACTAACPKEIPVTDVMYALKRMAVREGVFPKRFATPILAREFVRMAEDRGRSTESWVAMKSYLRTDVMELPKHAKVGIRLIRRGRMSFRREAMRDRAGLKKMLEAVER
jgi:heterodisulfide reductase subunit C